MFKIVLFLLILLAGDLAQAQGKIAAQPPSLQIPVLSPTEAIKLAEDHLTQVEHIERNKLRLSSVSYRYFSTITAPPGVIVVGWSIGFDCVPEQLDCVYLVEVLNSRKPKIVIYPPR